MMAAGRPAIRLGNMASFAKMNSAFPNSHQFGSLSEIISGFLFLTGTI